MIGLRILKINSKNSFDRSHLCFGLENPGVHHRKQVKVKMILSFLCVQIVSGLKTLLAKCPSVELREAAAKFLGKCGSKEIPAHLEVGLSALLC